MSGTQNNIKIFTLQPNSFDSGFQPTSALIRDLIYRKTSQRFSVFSSWIRPDDGQTPGPKQAACQNKNLNVTVCD